MPPTTFHRPPVLTRPHAHMTGLAGSAHMSPPFNRSGAPLLKILPSRPASKARVTRPRSGQQGREARALRETDQRVGELVMLTPHMDADQVAAHRREAHRDLPRLLIDDAGPRGDLGQPVPPPPPPNRIPDDGDPAMHVGLHEQPDGQGDGGRSNAA